MDADAVDEGIGALPAVPLLPALAGRLESVHGALATLAMRIDAVAAAMGSFRSTFGDRVDDYAETVARIQRGAAADLHEQRRGTERLVAELRRGVSDNDAALRHLAGRVDDVVSAMTDLARLVADRLPEAVGPTLDEVGEAVAEHAATALGSSFGAVRAELDEVRARVGALGPLGAAVLELGQGFDLLRDELVRSTRNDDIDEVRATVEAVRAEVARATGRRVLVEVRDALVALGGDPRLDRTLAELEELRGEVASGLGAAREEIRLLKRRLVVRAQAPVHLDDAQIDAIADAVLARLPAAATEADVDVDIDAVAGAVAAVVIDHLDDRYPRVDTVEAGEEPGRPRPERRRR